MSLINQVRENKRALKAELEQLVQKRDFGPADQVRFDEGVEKVKEFDARIDELLANEIRQSRAAGHNVELGVTEPGQGNPYSTASKGGDSVDVRSSGWSVSQEPHIYRDPHKDP